MNALTIRPAWTPLTVALTILGFVAWWPLGLAMIAYVIWGDRIGLDFSGLTRCGARFARNGFNATGFRRTGNSAFDDYREATLRRLEEERRKLEQEQRDFEEFLVNLRRARDKEEFDRFMAERSRRQGDV